MDGNHFALLVQSPTIRWMKKVKRTIPFLWWAFWQFSRVQGYGGVSSIWLSML
jgi:hypothetical protein